MAIPVLFILALFSDNHLGAGSTPSKDQQLNRFYLKEVARMTTPSQAAERYAQQKQREREVIRAKVARARAESTQEPFDFAVFSRFYDVSQDYGKRPITEEIMEGYEEQYYLGVPRASTIEEFAARKEELKLHDCT